MVQLGKKAWNFGYFSVFVWEFFLQKWLRVVTNDWNDFFQYNESLFIIHFNMKNCNLPSMKSWLEKEMFPCVRKRGDKLHSLTKAPNPSDFDDSIGMNDF